MLPIYLQNSTKIISQYTNIRNKLISTWKWKKQYKQNVGTVFPIASALLLSSKTGMNYTVILPRMVMQATGYQF